MASPSLDFINNRRYHKHRYKAKKKSHASTRLHQDASDKAIRPPGITQKRLTNKSGFGIKGAVVTSSFVKDLKGHGVSKPKKRSADFDLHCLLRAAKSKNVSDPVSSQSSGTSSAGVDDPSSNSVFQYPEENKIKAKNNRRDSQFPFKKNNEINSRSPSENNLQLFEKGKPDSEEMTMKCKMQTEKAIVMSDRHDDSDSLYHGSHESVSIEHHYNSSKNSALKSRVRPGLSAYQKFSVGIVDTLAAEKKKQFPSLHYCDDIALDLNNIYNETHKKMNLQDVDQNQLVVKPKILDIIKNKAEREYQFVPEVESKTKPEAQVCNADKKENLFREKTVQAWVEAIPKRILCENNMESEEKKDLSKPKVSHAQTEREFLKNISKAPSMFKSTDFNPLIKMDNKPFWDESDLVSPYMPPLNVLNPVNMNEEHGSDTKKGPDQLKHSFSLRNKPKQSYQETRNNPKKPDSKAGNYNFPMRQTEQPYCSQETWTSWCERGKTMSLESPSCPSPLITATFDRPAAKRSWFINMDFGGKVNSNMKSHEENLSKWTQFPKIARDGKKQKYHNESAILQSGTGAAKQTVSYIKFSPRKMF